MLHLLRHAYLKYVQGAHIGHERDVSVRREVGSARIENERCVSIRRGLGTMHTLRAREMATTASVAR